jgi:serine/threonine protein kinase
MLMGRVYTEKVDVYSFGIVLAEVATLQKAEDLPRTQEMTLDMVEVQNLLFPTAPKSFIKLIFQCCSLDQDKRPSFEVLSAELEKMRIASLRAPNSDPGAQRRRRTSSSINH